MSDLGDELDAASDLVDNGPTATQGHAIGNSPAQAFRRVDVPERPEAKMGGVPPEQWAAVVKKN